MKKITFCFLFVFLSSEIFGDEFYTSNLDAYVGIWNYTSSNMQFSMQLKRGTEKLFFMDNAIPTLIGDYVLIANKDTICAPSPINLNVTDENIGTAIIIANNASTQEEYVNDSILHVLFYDKTSQTRTPCTCTIQLLSKTKIELRFSASEGVYEDNVSTLKVPIPEVLILTKQRISIKR